LLWRYLAIKSEPETDMSELYKAVLGEIGAVTARIKDSEMDALCRLINGAGRVVVYGCGREALQIKGFAMRLYHLGLNVGVAGEMTAPPVGKGDVFLATSGPGELSTVLALMGEAHKAGAHCAVITAEPKGSAALAADSVLVIPAQTMASDQVGSQSSAMAMGSVFEGALFILFEVMVQHIQALSGAKNEDMRARHTNLE
jgi:6-phospho-3-hexuloisomerase